MRLYHRLLHLQQPPLLNYRRRNGNYIARPIICPMPNTPDPVIIIHYKTTMSRYGTNYHRHRSLRNAVVHRRVRPFHSLLSVSYCGWACCWIFNPFISTVPCRFKICTLPIRTIAFGRDPSTCCHWNDCRRPRRHTKRRRCIY